MGEKFIGVYPSDTAIPTLKNYPRGFVVNTDPIGQPGKHWQAVWVVNSASAEFFDSFGDEPKENLKKYLKKYKNVLKNTKIQNDYGPFVIYFLINRFKNIHFKNIIKTHKKYKYSDSFVKLFVFNLLLK